MVRRSPFPRRRPLHLDLRLIRLHLLFVVYPGTGLQVHYSADLRQSTHSQAFGTTRKNATSPGQILLSIVMFTRARRQVVLTIQWQFQIRWVALMLRAAAFGEGA